MEFAELVAEEYGWILTQARRLCRNRMDAEDLAGNAVLKILSSEDSYDFRRPFRPWCSVIVLNTYITKFNHDGLVSFTDIEGTAPAASSYDTSHRVQFAEVRNAIRRCRRKSSTVDCVLMYARGYSYDEIAERFGIPSGTVRSRINYARSLIRKELDIQYVK